ncbi:hypothetical protein EUS_15230 [[Eubacterium] siraeum 70/3]|uniref:Uncharacterized protein n=1 Tax=[Eubacterium] siraeum 70/3 TaxID=657319 RepID=D4JU75_9FIRM|nr:hypothetical protein EUS_15230 [[Eubacterium] siraeum 70/3]
MPLVYYRTNGSKKVSVCDTDIKNSLSFLRLFSLYKKTVFEINF